MTWIVPELGITVILHFKQFSPVTPSTQVFNFTLFFLGLLSALGLLHWLLFIRWGLRVKGGRYPKILCSSKDTLLCSYTYEFNGNVYVFVYVSLSVTHTDRHIHNNAHPQIIAIISPKLIVFMFSIFIYLDISSYMFNLITNEFYVGIISNNNLVCWVSNEDSLNKIVSYVS